MLRTHKRIGDAVSEGEMIGVIANPYEESDTPVRSPRRGIIIGAHDAADRQHGRRAVPHRLVARRWQRPGRPPRDDDAAPPSR